MIKRSLLLVSLALLLGGCQGYLDKDPDAALDISIDTEDKLQELLTGAYPTASYIPFLEPPYRQCRGARQWYSVPPGGVHVPPGRITTKRI